MKLRFSRKPINIADLKSVSHEGATRTVIIEKVIELDEIIFNRFANNLLDDYSFIKDNINIMHMDIDLTCHCILVKTKNAADGIVVESEGYSYARYAAYWHQQQIDEIQDICLFEKRPCKYAKRQDRVFECTAPSDYDMICRKR